MIAGIIQGNVRQSPYVNMEAAMRRRNYTLRAHGRRGLHHAGRGRGRQGAADRRRAASRPQPHSIAPYFLEEVRKELEARYGAKALYENGLSVQTASTCSCSGPPTARSTRACAGSTSGAASASRAQRAGARGTPSTTFRHPALGAPDGRRRHRAGRRHRRRRRPTIQACARALRTARSTRPATRGRARRAAATLVDARRSRRGADRPSSTPRRTRSPARLEQPPALEGRAPRDRQPHRPDPGDGRRLQLRAQQVQPRDAGVAAGRLGVQADRLHRGDRSRLHAGHRRWSTSRSSFPAGAGQPPYAPQNYDRKFEGPITLRRALEQSRNVPAVRLMDALGPKQVIAVRATARPHVAASAVPVDRARRRRSDAASR